MDDSEFSPTEPRYKTDNLRQDLKDLFEKHSRIADELGDLRTAKRLAELRARLLPGCIINVTTPVKAGWPLLL